MLKIKYLIFLTYLLKLLLRLLKITYLTLEKTDYSTKVNEILKKITDHNHDKYITTPEFNKLAWKSFAARLKQAKLASKSDIANFVIKTDFNNELKDVTWNKNDFLQEYFKIIYYLYQLKNTLHIFTQLL